MKKLLVISNHNPNNWSKEQLEQFKDYKIDFIQFPQINPEADYEEITDIALDIIFNIIEPGNYDYMTIQGEQSLIMTIVRHLYCSLNIMELPRWVIPTTKRESVEVVQNDGTTKKEQVFKFVQWREVF